MPRKALAFRGEPLVRIATGLRERLWDDVADAALRARRWVDGRTGGEHVDEFRFQTGEFLLTGSDFIEFAGEQRANVRARCLPIVSECEDSDDV